MEANKLEKKIIGLIGSIKRKETPKENSGVGQMLITMKKLDEPLYNELMNKYKEAIK